MARVKYMVALAVLAFMWAGQALAHGPSFPQIATDELKAKIDKQEKVFVVDVRTVEEYAAGHLPGAINVPPDQYNVIGGLLPKDKKYLVVFYCRGYT